MATVYETKNTRYGTVQIENGGYHKYALMVNGKVECQTDDWNFIKRKYDEYN